MITGTAMIVCSIAAQFTPTGGGDHAGLDWTPANGSTIAGVHTNVGSFIVPAGFVVFIEPFNGTQFGTVEIQCASAQIDGVIDGNGGGFPGGQGGAQAGGNGTQDTSTPNLFGRGGGGGGGNLGIGGNGAGPSPFAGLGGSAGPTGNRDMGGGGGTGALGGIGGAGGAAIAIISSTGAIAVTGQISVEGGNGLQGAPGTGGGAAGAGGSIFLEARCSGVTLTGFLSVVGGAGANATTTTVGADTFAGGGGGGGGGGVVTLLQSYAAGKPALNAANSNVSGGTAGISSVPGASPGEAGTANAARQRVCGEGNTRGFNSSGGDGTFSCSAAPVSRAQPWLGGSNAGIGMLLFLVAAAIRRRS